MKFAIIDTETTGVDPKKNKITEIAIIISDGQKILDSFFSLINPQCLIPPFISNLTGISNEMVRSAPQFSELAKTIHMITEDCVFVAHNARFDYGFVSSEFSALGNSYIRKTLCTVKLARKVIPKLPSYSLGNLCGSLQIPIESRHRAFGDAKATSLLLEKLLLADVNQVHLQQIHDPMRLATKRARAQA